MSTLKANSYQHVDRASPSIIINSDGSVSISSTVTYEDVTSVDAVGVITGRSNADLQNRVNVGSGVSIKAGGLNVTAGISTFGGTSTFNDDVTFTGAAANVTWDKSVDDLIFGDDAKAAFGDASDLVVYHNGTSSYLTNSTGNLILESDSYIWLGSKTGSEAYIKGIKDGAVELYYDNVPTLYTVINGIHVKGGEGTVGELFLSADESDDNADKWKLIASTDASRLQIQNKNSGSWENSIECNGDGAVALYHDNTKVADSTSVGLKVYGTSGRLTSNNGSTEGYFGFNGAGGFNIGGAALPTQVEAGGSNYITLATNSSERIRITSAGLVGIGTAAAGASSNAMLSLHTSGSSACRFNLTNTGSSSAESTQIWSQNNDLAFNTGAGERLRLRSDGTVDIGGGSHSRNLTVHSATNSVILIEGNSDATSNLMFGDENDEDVGMMQYNHVDNDLAITVNASERLTINSSGNANFTGIVTATQFVPTENQTGGFKNLIINGDMNVAQRGTASTSDVQGYTTVDRMKVGWGGADSIIESRQGDLASSDTGPWAAGFRHAYYLVNGNQNGGAQSGDHAYIEYTIEAQDIANSGWDYTNTSSYLTLSYWVKSSVAQTFYGYLYTYDGSSQTLSHSTGALSANTWTKVTLKIPGHANLQFDNNNSAGLTIYWWPYCGTDRTTSGNTLNAWQAYASANRMPDNTSTWWTTNDATFWLTGLQLEVGSEATPFEHMTYAEQLRRCQRYFVYLAHDGNNRLMGGYKRHDNNVYWNISTPVPMRVAPSPTLTDGGLFTNFQSTFTAVQSSPTIAEWETLKGQGLLNLQTTWSSTHEWIPSWESYVLYLSAEL